MQDTTRPTTVKTLPRLGDGLARLRGWEHDFRVLAAGRGFSELNLPLSLPSSELVSGLTGESTLPEAPRFVDSNATEWTLRSDLTLFSAQFVCRNRSDLHFPFKLFYSGKVFSPQGILGAEGFRLGHASEFESYEFGAEIIGESEIDAEIELLELAICSLKRFGYQGIRVVFGDARLLKLLEDEVVEGIEDSAEKSSILLELRTAIQSKDFARLIEFIRRDKFVDERWKRSGLDKNMLSLINFLKEKHADVNFQIDPLLTRQRKFYTGVVFDFWAEDFNGRLHSVGGGGRYDNLLQHFGRPSSAAGFMIRDPNTAGVFQGFVNERQNSLSSTIQQRRPVRVALPKGRLQKWGVEAFAQIGVLISEDLEKTRKLVLKSECGGFEFLLVKNADVVSYVERGIAEMAIAGSDVLDEQAHSLLRPITFAFGRCRICLAGKPEQRDALTGPSRKRVATKYPHLAMRLLRAKGLNPEIVPLQGSVELASVIEFSDAIVDLVETGSTLRENGLVVFDDLTQTRVQLVMSRSYFVESHLDLRHWLHHWNLSSSVIDAHFQPIVLGAEINDSNSEKI